MATRSRLAGHSSPPGPGWQSEWQKGLSGLYVQFYRYCGQFMENIDIVEFSWIKSCFDENLFWTCAHYFRRRRHLLLWNWRRLLIGSVEDIALEDGMCSLKVSIHSFARSCTMFIVKYIFCDNLWHCPFTIFIVLLFYFSLTFEAGQQRIEILYLQMIWWPRRPVSNESKEAAIHPTRAGQRRPDRG